MKYPSHDLVAERWLGTLALTASGYGPDLPADPTSWAPGGFVQATALGGIPDAHIPEFAPTVQIDCWANRPGSELPPWHRAGDLAGQVMAATLSYYQTVLIMPLDYRPVRVQSVSPLTEPRKIKGDPSGFARVSLDIVIHWSWAS